MRVLVAMSGGVDSSVAAAQLVQAGHDVVGVTLHLWDYPEQEGPRGRCCAPEDVHDARKVSSSLNIPHFAFDRRELFRDEIVEPFVASYLAGETPSPCVQCNRGIKLQELMRLRTCLDADFVATGHYARIHREGGKARLFRGRDRAKDQSYFLHMLPEDTLSKLLFPLGDLCKSEVRATALALGLAGAGKGESQELCFVADGRYDEFVATRARDRLRPGPILDVAGRPLGTHHGIHAFTVGQRRNLGVSVGRRAYVNRIDPSTATVVVGSREEATVSEALLVDVVCADDFALPSDCEVAVRYRAIPVPARISPAGPGAAAVRFREPAFAVVPGQYGVFYQGDRVLGGGRFARPREVPWCSRVNGPSWDDPG